MALLREVYAVIGQGDVPLPGIGKAGTQPLRQGLAEPGEGAGVINELWAGDPLAQSHWRRCDQQDLVSVQGNAREKTLQPLGSLLRAKGMSHFPASAKRVPSRSARVWQSRAKVQESSMSCGLGTHSPKAIGGGATSRILFRSREMPERKRSSRSAACSGLRPWSRSLVPSMTISRSVSAGKAGTVAGISRPFCPMLKIVHPFSTARISTHRQSAS